MADTLLNDVVSTIVTADSIQRPVKPAQLRKLIEEGRFFWLDIAGQGEVARAEILVRARGSQRVQA